MYSIDSVTFELTDQDGNLQEIVVYVNCPDFTFSQADLSQLILQGIESIFKPNLSIEGLNVITKSK